MNKCKVFKTEVNVFEGILEHKQFLNTNNIFEKVCIYIRHHTKILLTINASGNLYILFWIL